MNEYTLLGRAMNKVDTIQIRGIRVVEDQLIQDIELLQAQKRRLELKIKRQALEIERLDRSRKGLKTEYRAMNKKLLALMEVMLKNGE